MRILCLLLLISLLSACAAKKMAAENADFVLETQIQRRLPLYSAQKVSLSEDIDKFLLAEKPTVKRALPVLNAVELNVNRVDDQYQFLKTVFDELSLRFSQLLSNHMAPLDQKQQKDFLRNLEKENQRIRATKASELRERVEERFEKLFGRMSPEQEQLLSEYAPFFQARNAERLERRQKLHERFRGVYAMDLSREARAAYFYEAFVDYHHRSINSEKNLELIKRIIPTLDQKQRDIFHGRVQELKEILRYYLEADF